VSDGAFVATCVTARTVDDGTTAPCPVWPSQRVLGFCYRFLDAQSIEALRTSPLTCAPEELPVDQNSARPRVVDVKRALTW